MLFYETIERLRSLAEDPRPLLVSVEGRLGLSPLGVVLQATEDGRRVVFVPPALTDRDNRMALAVRLAPHAPWKVPPDNWRELFAAMAEMAPLTVVIEEPEALAAANRDFWRELGQAWREVRRSGARVHLFLSSQGRGLGETLNTPDSPLWEAAMRIQPGATPAPVRVVHLGIGTHYDLAAAVPRWQGGELLLGWSIFGGLPGLWGLAGSRGSPAAALRRGLLRGSRPLVEGPRALLERAVGKANRYAAILRAIATGAESWPELSARIPGTAGPYLLRLRELGLVDAERPVDAPPRSRRTRYRLSDPHEVFWWSVIHRLRPGLVAAAAAGPEGTAERIWKEAIRPSFAHAVRHALPLICRNYLRFGCEPVLGARARTAGPLWGSGFDFPVAGTLASGAVCYGHIHPGPAPAPAAILRELDQQIRATRYGYGRQARLRLIFSLSGFERELQRMAVRDARVWLIGEEELAAEARQPW